MRSVTLFGSLRVRERLFGAMRVAASKASDIFPAEGAQKGICRQETHNQSSHRILTPLFEIIDLCVILEMEV
ncbi:hypothetical protein scyTo_0021473 [Scyliorhinus torazame]|uniref:Uncharacterized protein n=1 Tax=Scyliorhinus torazame TaxID=75743 RepID=A0A401Q8Z2_SCYTO|nr:hypothetical protein [Scyliorhinus torazame]